MRSSRPTCLCRAFQPLTVTCQWVWDSTHTRISINGWAGIPKARMTVCPGKGDVSRTGTRRSQRNRKIYTNIGSTGVLERALGFVWRVRCMGGFVSEFISSTAPAHTMHLFAYSKGVRECTVYSLLEWRLIQAAYFTTDKEELAHICRVPPQCLGSTL